MQLSSAQDNYLCLFGVYPPNKCISLKKKIIRGLTWWSSGQESSLQFRGHMFDPWSRRIPHAVSNWVCVPQLVSPQATTTEERKKVKSLSPAQLFATPWTVACTKLLRLWDFPGKSTGVGCPFLLQGIFPTQGSNLGLPHYRQTHYHLSQACMPKACASQQGRSLCSATRKDTEIRSPWTTTWE